MSKRQKENIFWQYKGVCGFMAEYPATYGMEKQRADLHKELEDHYKTKKEKENLKFILHNLPASFDLDAVETYMKDIEGFKKDLKKYYS